MTLVKRNSGIFYEHRCAGKFAGAIVRRIINNNIGIITVLSLSEDRMLTMLKDRGKRGTKR